MIAPAAQKGPIAAEGITTTALRPPRFRDLRTDCGISRSDDPGRRGRACQFIRPRYDALEAVHFGPKGTEFARARVEMKSIEGITTLRRERPKRMKRMVPVHTWQLAEPYGLAPKDGEAADAPRRISR